MFNLPAGKNFVPTWSHYFPDLSIPLPSLFRPPTISIFLAHSRRSICARERERESNKYPVTVRNCSVHAGLIQPALLQHPRVYGRGKFTRLLFPLFQRLCSTPRERNTRPCDRHGDFFFLPSFLHSFFFNLPLPPPPLPPPPEHRFRCETFSIRWENTRKRGTRANFSLERERERKRERNRREAAGERLSNSWKTTFIVNCWSNVRVLS